MRDVHDEGYGKFLGLGQGWDQEQEASRIRVGVNDRALMALILTRPLSATAIRSRLALSLRIPACTVGEDSDSEK